MENLGKYLQETRKAKGIDYAQIWEDIRIGEAQIRALEENRLFDLGHYGFVKVLVYNYARYLEADLDAVMQEFRVMMPANTKKEFKPSKVVKEKKIMLSTNFLWTVGIVVIVAILGSILFQGYRQGWLKTPDFFSREDKPQQSEPVEDEPLVTRDSLRIRMRILSESIPQSNVITSDNHTFHIAADTTDYIGNILGESPVNVPIH
ncbi:MAG: helix-turn-helix domain-containing protein [Candidatus Cloacimonetes bacterium]|jgi:cytoskeletal protein RodZ|nr:helix-turn-helix domain-containing protein [Candidatus Cloacimonadota bacterium]MDD2506104.1 helix-turn-helix domain-containing protein [Candidatus Cloacimonadota bacterium]MDD4148240.1 helix-turn-helix domain-containing protein [Candidatus Cloacimonadota bacterium]MDD4559746.1 helix-turn-helix domain-containing protein [Candidatus Cloacimonadota bacterium]